MMIIINASYGICAPFLPHLSDEHDVDQSYLGIMFCAYSISMAIMSPISGKFQYSLGRRNVVQYGLFIVGLPFLGFYFINLMSRTSTSFILLFILMRVIQGIGTSMSQTSIYSILTYSYPEHVSLVVGCIEGSAGIGLCIGPLIGTLTYKIGGLNAPFLTFFIVLTLFSLIVKYVIPKEADKTDKSTISTKDISYTKLLMNSRIIFANMSVFFAQFQLTFIDPVLANYLHTIFDINYEDSGYFFLVICLGYTISSTLVHLSTKFVSNRHLCMIASIGLGLFTMMYAPSYILHLPSNEYLVLFALLLTGITGAQLIITPMDEMIEVGQQVMNLDSNNNALNDV